jgi:hypothetical protein
MLEFLRPIVILDTWLYIILGLIALFFVRLMWLARRDRVRSIFTLERENATIRMTRAFTGLVIVFGLAMGVYWLSLVTPEIVPPLPDTPTPTPIVALPPTPTPPPLILPTPTPTQTPVPTFAPTPTPEITPTATPNTASVGVPANCPNPGVNITQPGHGAQVNGIVTVMGAATVDNFDYYKFEFRVPSAEEWVFIARFDNPVPEGVLGAWNSDTVPPGVYEFRLVVVDATGNFPEPCVINLVVR